MNTIAVILARGGSKGVPKKNIKMMAGKPLIVWTIEAALESKMFTHLVVSTDSEEIAEVARQHGAQVPFMRPDELAQDHIWSRDALKHAVLASEEHYGVTYDYVVELPCTNPLRTSKHIVEAVNKLVTSGADSVTAVTSVQDKHPNRMKRIVDDQVEDFTTEYPGGEGSRRQNLEPCFIGNGAIFAMTRECIVDQFSRHGKICRPYIMPEECSINIDTDYEFKLAEFLFKNKNVVNRVNSGPRPPAYVIAEIANAAQGIYQDNFELIKKAKESGAPGVKFQFYKYDALTTPAYSKYEIYKKTFYTAEQRSEFVKYAKSLGLDVWVDVFDSWGLGVVRDNIEDINGIKIPPTVSLNHKLVADILSLKSDIPILLGVGGLNDKQVDSAIHQVKDSNKKIILMYGYQGFPTNEKDTVLSRIKYLKEKYGYNIGFADHVDAESDLNIKMPCYAYFAGADIIEKHITLNRSAKGYDYYSSLEPNEYEELVKELERSGGISGTPDSITQDQEKYMLHAVRAVLSCDKNKGDLIFENEIDFKRTGNPGDFLPNEIGSFFPAKATKDLKVDSPLNLDTTTKAKAGIVVLCRLNSTRLPKKAILELGGVSAIQRCLNNCLKSELSDVVVLATSTDINDAPLEEHLVGGVEYFKGDPENPAKRILQVADQYNLDYVVRVTGDSPLVSYELIDQLISSHLASGAEYSYIENAPLGLKPEIFNTNAIKRLINNLETEKYSEYLTLYFKNNPDFFEINRLELSDKDILKYKDARFTLDYEEDYNFLSSIFNKVYTKEHTKLSELFDILDNNSQLLNINSHINPKYVKNKKLVEELNRVTKIKAGVE